MGSEIHLPSQSQNDRRIARILSRLDRLPVDPVPSRLDGLTGLDARHGVRRPHSASWHDSCLTPTLAFNPQLEHLRYLAAVGEGPSNHGRPD
jgi:hypothetical protein